MVHIAKSFISEKKEPRTVKKLSFQKFPLWIKLWNVPFELFTIDGISCIANAVGIPLYMDRDTQEW